MSKFHVSLLIISVTGKFIYRKYDITVIRCKHVGPKLIQIWLIAKIVEGVTQKFIILPQDFIYIAAPISSTSRNFFDTYYMVWTLS